MYLLTFHTETLICNIHSYYIPFQKSTDRFKRSLSLIYTKIIAFILSDPCSFFM